LHHGSKRATSRQTEVKKESDREGDILFKHRETLHDTKRILRGKGKDGGQT
jgi:hypothetical protein